jgi:hypothetical protein
MHKLGLLGSTVASTRRRGALSLFRLASVVLRGATGLYEKGLIPRASVRAALSIAGLLQRWAAALHPCLGRSRQTRLRPAHGEPEYPHQDEAGSDHEIGAQDDHPDAIEYREPGGRQLMKRRCSPVPPLHRGIAL